MAQSEHTLRLQVDVAVEDIAANELAGGQQITLPTGYGSFRLEKVQMRASANTNLNTATLYLSDTVLDNSAMPADEDALYRSSAATIGSAHARNAFLIEVPDTVANHDHGGWRSLQTASTLYVMLALTRSDASNSGTIRITAHFTIRR